MRTLFLLRNLRRRISRRAFAVGVALTAGACAHAPSKTPPSDELTLEEFMNGDDLQSDCHVGRPDHFRLVFRSDDGEQAFSYDVIADSAAPFLTDDDNAVGEPGERFGIFGEKPPQIAAEVELRLLPSLSDRNADDAPWRRGGVRLRLSPVAFAALTDRLSENGAFAPPPEGLRFPTEGFRWLVSGCRAGARVLAVRPPVPGAFVPIRHRFVSPSTTLANRSEKLL